MHPEGFTVMPEHYEAIRDTIIRDSKVGVRGARRWLKWRCEVR